MVFKVINGEKSAIVDNTGEENGKVKITGNSDLVRVLDFHINNDYELFGDLYKVALKNFGDLILKNKTPVQLHKASDAYLKQYLIPKILEGVLKFKIQDLTTNIS